MPIFVHRLIYTIHLLKFLLEDMRFIILSFLLFIALFVGSLNFSFASHTMGADLTYQSLGGETYQFTLSFYRDCYGIDAPTSVSIDIKSVSCGINTTLNLQPVTGTGKEITPICPTTQTTCNGGSYTGIQEWVYTGTYTLPAKCSDWILSYDICCRNAAITTISSPDLENLYVEAHLDNLNVSGNSSPSFSNKPVPFVCVGQLFCFNHGAIDLDGDSLVYTLVDPMTSVSTAVNYNTGYSATNPLKSNPALTFDGITGDFCVTPSLIEVTVMAVLVEEYRNGVLIGSVIRDIQITVDNCNNENPEVDGINGTGKFDTSVCAGTQLCFVTNGSDPDAGQKVSMSWNSAISGASFTTTGTGPTPQGTFCWTPTTADASSVPYCFTVEVRDDNCPYNGIQSYSFCISVTGLQVDAGLDQSISCLNTTTLNGTASGGSGNFTYLWSSGDTTTSTTVSSGTHVLYVDDGAGCTGEDSVTVTYYDAPVANLTYSSGCSNPILFTDSTTISGGPTIVSWKWDFGDGNTSIQQNPSNNYAQQGVYVITLIATSSLGCADTITETLSINPGPVADFSNTTVCLGQASNFTDLSTVVNSNIIDWQWDFGDSSTDNTQHTSHQYTSSGLFNVTLTITTDSNCLAQITKAVEVSTTPIAAFTISDICLNQGATPVNTTSIASGTIGSYDWNFGDGGSSSLQSPIHSYTQAGVYTIELIAASSGGCADTASQTITVNGSPTANFTAANACLGMAIPFSDLSSSNTTLVNWEWNFSNGMTSAEQSPSLVFPTASQLTAQLIVSDNNGCTDTASSSFTVYPIPLASFSVKDACLNEVSTFTDLSSITSGSVVSWQWDFKDGNTSSSQHPSNMYALDTSYTVQLIVTSDNGCTDTLEQLTTVNPLPQVDLVPDLISGCEDLAINFTDLSSITKGSIISYAWNFGDGATSASQSPTHLYSTAGTYSVTLTATSDKGCKTTFTSINLITVYPLPISEFNFSPQTTSILYPKIDFDDASSTDAISWLWDFGDGNTSSIQSPTYSYTDSGTYTIKLIVVNNYGCIDSVSYDVRINPDGILYIPNTFTPNNDGINDNFIGKGYGILEYEMNIYDRWGTLIYSCNDTSRPWDGKVQGTSKLAPVDVYIYHIFVKVQPEKKHTYIGRISLVR